MRPDPLSITWIILLAVTWSSARGDKITFEDNGKEDHSSNLGAQELPTGRQFQPEFQGRSNRTRQGKNLLDWIGLGTGQHIDPYLARTNEGCLNGDFSDCFKSRALNTFADFFDQQQYNLNENVKVVQMSRDIVKHVANQPFEYSSTSRSDDSEWDQLVKFAMRKAERFLKTTAIEVDVPAWLTGENEVYAPRFLDEIADEIDIIENKKDSLFSRHRLRKLFIPMLIILKLFKLKLLLFLPLILGLASFKKFLGFLAIIVPGLIGFFKICKPITQSYTPPIYSQSGVGFPGSHYKEGHAYESHNQGPYESHNHGSYAPYHHDNHNDGTVSFGGQDLAYQGYRPDYQK